MPNPTQRPQPNYPITRLSNGQLISRDPGLINTPLYNAAANNSGMRLRVYDPASNTTHAIFNNGKTADFDRHGRLMDSAGAQNARNINQMHYESATGTAPYSAPRPTPVAVRPAPPVTPPPRPAVPRTQVRKDKTGFTIVTAPNGSVKYFDPNGNPATAQAWGKVSGLHGQTPEGGASPFWEGLKAGGGEVVHQAANVWNGSVNLASQSLGNAGDYLNNSVREGQGILSGDQNEVQSARDGKQRNVQALRGLAEQMTPGTFKDIAQATGQAAAGDWDGAWNTVSAIPGKNAQAFKDDPQQWAMNFASTVAPLGEGLLAKSASMTRLAAGFRAMGQGERAVILDARAAALKAIGNGMTLKPITEAAETSLTRLGSKVPIVGKFVERTAEANAKVQRMAEQQSAAADLNHELRGAKAVPSDPNAARMALANRTPSNKPTTMVVERPAAPAPSVTIKPSASPKFASAAMPLPAELASGGVKQFTTDAAHADPVAGASGAAAEDAGDKLQQGRDALVQAGMSPDDANTTLANGVFGPELAAVLNHHADGADVQAIVPGQGVAVSDAGDLSVHPTHTIVVHGEPAAVAPVVKSVSAMTPPGETVASRPAIPGEALGPNDTKSTSVQIAIPSGAPPEVAISVAKDLSGHPDIVDRNGGPLISNPTIIHDADGAAVIHDSSYANQQQYGTSPADFATDVGEKSDEIAKVLDSYGLPPNAISVHPTITTVPAAPDAAPSLLDRPTTGDNSNASASESSTDSNASGPQPYSAGPGEPAPQGPPVGNSVDPPTPLDEAASSHFNRRVDQAVNDPQGFAEANGSQVRPPDSPPPDANIASTEGAPANAGALSDSGSASAAQNATLSRVERLQQELGVNADTLRQNIEAKKERDQLMIGDDDPDGAQLFDDTASYGAIKIASGQGFMRFSDWQRQMAAEVGDWIRPNLKRLWDTSQGIYRSAEDGQMWLHQPGEREAASLPRTPQRLSPSAQARLAEPDPDPSLVAQGVVPPRNPKAYSTWFEMALNEADYGMNRGLHFLRANEALAAHFRANPEFAALMEELSPGINSHVSGNNRTPPQGFTWEHASSSTSHGRLGIMRLVPNNQHLNTSPWWRPIHPDLGAAGGYSEWAIPFGAPRN